MLTFSKPHIQTTTDTTSFRIYLRNHFYHSNMSKLVDILYQNFSTSDVQIDDNLQITIKVRKRKNTMDTIDFCNDINIALIELFESCNLLNIIESDLSLSDDQRKIFIDTYNLLCNNSSYMSYMYSSVLIDQTILTIDL